MKLRLAIGLLATVVLVAGCSGSDRILVGAGTTTVDSGLIAAVESRYSGSVSVVGGSTAEILASADQGSFDVAIVHDEEQESAFLADHPDAVRRGLFTSRFLIVGPTDLAGQIAAGTPAEALAEIAARGWTFVTRADGSGTHAREMQLWALSGMDPVGEWYVATGQGMGFTLQVTDQRSAFTIVEEGAFLAARDTLTLTAIEFPDDTDLMNPYSAILVNESGRTFFEWLTGLDGRNATLLANDEVFGQVVYRPSQDSEQ